MFVHVVAAAGQAVQSHGAGERIHLWQPRLDHSLVRGSHSPQDLLYAAVHESGLRDPVWDDTLLFHVIK